MALRAVDQSNLAACDPIRSCLALRSTTLTVQGSTHCYYRATGDIATATTATTATPASTPTSCPTPFSTPSPTPTPLPLSYSYSPAAAASPARCCNCSCHVTWIMWTARLRGNSTNVQQTLPTKFTSVTHSPLLSTDHQEQPLGLATRAYQSPTPLHPKRIQPQFSTAAHKPELKAETNPKSTRPNPEPNTLHSPSYT